MSAEPGRTRVRGGELAIALGVASAWVLLVRPGPLSLPYFWDEGDVYAPGARWLAEHDLDPTPGHFPDDWSRGHPPLFYLITALLFRMFGSGPFVGHALIVPFTALALAGTYALGVERGGRFVGLGAAALLGTSPLFMSMGAFLLPEMPLTALTVLALWALSRGKIGVAAVLGVAMVWIKETGVFTALAIAGGIFISSARTGKWRESIRPVVVSLAPLVALGVFFLWQRATAGYFVFPVHQDLFANRPLAFENVWSIVPSTFFWHGRWIATFAAIGLAIFLLVSRRVPKTLRLDPTNLAMALLVLGNAMFFTKSFWLERYALPAHPGVCVLLSMILFEGVSALVATSRHRVLVAGLPIAIASAVGVFSLGVRDTNAPEHTFAFADVVMSHREAFERVVREHEDARVLTTWPLTTELREPWLGFVDAPLQSMHPDHLGDHPDFEIDVVLVDSNSRNAERLRLIAEERGMSLEARIEYGSAPTLELWQE